MSARISGIPRPLSARVRGRELQVEPGVSGQIVGLDDPGESPAKPPSRLRLVAEAQENRCRGVQRLPSQRLLVFAYSAVCAVKP